MSHHVHVMYSPMHVRCCEVTIQTFRAILVPHRAPVWVDAALVASEHVGAMAMDVDTAAAPCPIDISRQGLENHFRLKNWGNR